MGAPHSECLSMASQAFGIGQGNARRRDSEDSFAGHLLAGNDADEVAHAETAPHTGHPTRGQHMVWSRDIVPRGLGSELIEKNRARVLDCRRQRWWEREMLGSDAIRYLDGLVKRRDQKNGATPRE